MQEFPLVLLLALFGTVSCTVIPPLQNSPPPEPLRPQPQPPSLELPRASNDAETLVQYGIYLKRLPGAELNREFDSMKQNVARARTDLNRAQLALFYALPGLAPRDGARAAAMLDALGKDASSPVIRNFAVLLLSLVADNRRLDDSLLNLNNKLKEEQKQTAELQQKLDALKSIEKSLSERDHGKTAAPTR